MMILEMLQCLRIQIICSFCFAASNNFANIPNQEWTIQDIHDWSSSQAW